MQENGSLLAPAFGFLLRYGLIGLPAFDNLRPYAMETQILSGYGTDPEVTALLDAFDWVIIPSINPDGYAYTWSTVSC